MLQVQRFKFNFSTTNKNAAFQVLFKNDGQDFSSW